MIKNFKIKKQSEVLVLDENFCPERSIILGDEVLLGSEQIEGPIQCECGECNNEFFCAELSPSLTVQVSAEDISIVNLN